MLLRMREDGPKYVAELVKGKKWICAKYKGNILKLMNHNCDNYNCELRIFKEDNGRLSLGIWTINDIQDDEDMFFYYHDNESSHIGSSIQCLCKGTLPNGKCICLTTL